MPLLAVVSRLVEQKGFDLVAHVLDELLQMDLQLAVLGAGDAVYEQMFAGAAARFPDKCAVRIGFDEALARRMYAAADLFLMPSRFEPCGLGQLLAMRYMAVPVVRETGGLKDTVIPYNEFTGEGTGIGFANYNAHELLDAVRKGLRLYADRAAWERLAGNIAAVDFGWERSAEAYLELYRQVAAPRPV